MLERMADPDAASSRLLRVVRWAMVPAIALLLLVGVVFVVGQTSSYGDEVKIALAVAYFVAAGFLLGTLTKGRPELRSPFRVSVLLAAVLLTGWYLESLRGEERQETLVEASPASATRGDGPDRVTLVSEGSFEALEHNGDGQAEVVKDGDALALQLRDFETDAGPDLRVYLSTDASAADFVDLGKLKGNSGNQRYDIPAGTDTSKYKQILVWCRAFSVGFTAAKLKPAS